MVLMILISMSAQAMRSERGLSSAFGLYFANVYSFSHACIIWDLAFAGGKRNVKAGSYGTRSYRIERA